MRRTRSLVVGAVLIVGAAAGPVAAQEDGPSTTVPVETTVPIETVPIETVPIETTTTVQLSAPSASSTVAPTAAPTTTVAAQVLGAQEEPDDELPATGAETGLLLAVALVLGLTGAASVATGGRRQRAGSRASQPTGDPASPR